MIELLIVIAVLGILAVAVLAAINPIEQINRGKDTGSQSDAEQLLGAIDRYYASLGYYPWMESADDTDGEVVTWQEIDTVVDSDGCNILTKLGPGEGACTGSQEIKLSFVNRVAATDYNDLWIYNRGDPGDSVYICFLPKSGSFETEASDRCTAGLPTDLNTIVDTVCGGSPDNYHCLP